MPLGSSRTMPSSRFLKSSFFLAGGLTFFLSGCLSGVTDERGSKDSSNGLAVGMAQTSDVSGWMDADIGAVGQAGSSTISGASATVRGSGADIWGNADGFHFTYKKFSGRFTLTARVTGVQATDPWAKAGIMIRENTSPESPHIFLALTSGNGAARQSRGYAGGESHHIGLAGGAPIWFRLERLGELISSYYSADGVTWTLTGESITGLTDWVVAGLAVTSHNNAALNSSTFDNITWTDVDPPTPWTAQDIGNVGLAGSTRYNGGRYTATWTVKGAGSDIFNTADAFHFYHRPLIGDGSITSAVSFITDTHQWAKAGLMIRESAAPGSRHVYIGLTPSGVVEFLRREVEGGSTLPVAAAGGTGFWFRATRVGDVFTVSYSPDKQVWTQMGQVTMALKPDILMGLAVTSHNPSVLNEAVFFNMESVE